ncbi:MAG: VirE protein [Bacteroides sp.]|nr:VirE protein [Bacteroides sp.]
MFGIGYNIKSKVRECTPELLDKVLDSSSVAKTCAELEDALERCRRGELTKDEYETLKGELKKVLPVATFHATFKHGRRKNDEAIPSGLSIYDIDHIPNPRAKWEEIAPRKEELGIVMAHITPSTEGLRLVFVIPTAPGTNRLMSLAEAQAWMASMLGDTTYDVCVKDYARCSFLVPREYVLFLSERLFETTGVILRNEETKNLETQSGCIQILRDAQDDKDNVPQDDKMGGGPQDDKDNVPQDDKTGGGRGNNTPTYPETYENIPYTKIVETLEEQMGGRPEHGSRNNFIFSMACHLRYICDDDPDWIATILPTYGEAREKWMASIRSACARNQTRSFPNIMRRTLKIAQSGCTQILRDAQNDTGVALPPEMPTNLPPLIELLVSRTPDIYKPAVAHAVFPALGAHLWRTTFRYIDNVHHEATLMNVLMAGTGAGKNCITEPVNRILADIRRRDKENMLREKAWKKEMQSMGANKNKRQRPEGLVIQEIDPDMTNAAFVQRLADADGKFLYTKMNEIDQFDALKTSANRKSQFQIMCLAFDPGNVYGQTRIGTGSVTERVCIRFNWNASTTIQKGQAYFRSVLTDGPISRINFCTIPEREIGAPMPVYGSYDMEFDRQLATYIDHLNAARGEVECPEAFALAQTLSEECAEFARLSQSRVYENLSFRANVIAYLKAMVLYVAHGEEWSQEIEDFVRWSLQYDMWCKMAFFAESIEETEGNNTSHHTRKGPQNLLDLLPKVFTYEDAAQVKQRVTGQSGSPKAMLNNWIRRGYIEIYGEGVPTDVGRQQYIKTPAYLNRYDNQ